MKRNACGLSLAELLVVLAIAAVLLSVSIPPLNSMVERNRAASSMKFLYHNLQLARTQAIMQNRRITICGTADGISCIRRWENIDLMIFFDENGNKQRESSEPLLRLTPVPSGIFAWRGANRDYLRYQRDGSVIEFGTFTYCNATRDPRYARQLTINRAGRAYWSKDSDGDGLHEGNVSKGPISCP